MKSILWVVKQLNIWFLLTVGTVLCCILNLRPVLGLQEHSGQTHPPLSGHSSEALEWWWMGTGTSWVQGVDDGPGAGGCRSCWLFSLHDEKLVEPVVEARLLPKGIAFCLWVLQQILYSVVMEEPLLFKCIHCLIFDDWKKEGFCSL